MQSAALARGEEDTPFLEDLCSLFITNRELTPSRFKKKTVVKLFPTHLIIF
jgi:hypothetical protein